MAGALRPERLRGDADGFTLIELLVGLALMGMAASLLLVGLQSVGVIALRERTAASGLEQVVSAQRLLRSTIVRLRPVSRPESNVPLVDFWGEPGNLRFIAPALDRAGPAALERYWLDRTVDGNLLLYSASTRAAGVDITARTSVGWTPLVVLTGVSGLSIAYFGARSGDETPQWHPYWQSQPASPELVRIRVQFREGDQRVWPDLVIRPRAIVASSCVSGRPEPGCDGKR